MKKGFIFVMIVSTLLIGLNAVGEPEKVVIKHIRPESETDKRPRYYVDLLRLVLERTQDVDGAFHLKPAEKRMFQGRAIISLQKGEALDVVWTMTSKEREEDLLPIRIPLLKGLLGYRIFLIRPQDTEKFAAITTLEDLKSLTAGQGHDWPDTKILRANGLQVITAGTYDGLFEMLERGRIDYFPRGVNEPWAELQAHPESELIVEESILLKYPAAIYFFVNKKDRALANRIERGLRLMMKDGSFDEFFHTHPHTQPIFERANLEQRKTFTLENPLLPPETPLDEEELWYAQ